MAAHTHTRTRTHMHTPTHKQGAVHVNLAGLMKKRFVAGKIGLADLVTSDEGKEKFKVSNIFKPLQNYMHVTVPVYSIHVYRLYKLFVSPL